MWNATTSKIGKAGSGEGANIGAGRSEREGPGGGNRMNTATADADDPDDQGLPALAGDEEQDEDTEFFEKEAGKRYKWDGKAGII